MNVDNKTLTIIDIQSMSTEQITNLYKQGYRIEGAQEQGCPGCGQDSMNSVPMGEVSIYPLETSIQSLAICTTLTVAAVGTVVINSVGFAKPSGATWVYAGDALCNEPATLIGQGIAVIVAFTISGGSAKVTMNTSYKSPDGVTHATSTTSCETAGAHSIFYVHTGQTYVAGIYTSLAASAPTVVAC